MFYLALNTSKMNKENALHLTDFFFSYNDTKLSQL